MRKKIIYKNHKLIDEAQMHNYLKASGLKLGIIINYGKPSLE